MARVSSFDVYKSVKNALNTTGNNLTNFCDLVSKLSKDKSRRLVLSSVDSIFDGVNLPENLRAKKEGESIMLANSLVKLPKAVFLPRNSQEDTKAHVLPQLLEKSLTRINSSKKKYTELNSIFMELRKTAQFLSDNSLHDNYGPLRPFLFDFLTQYQENVVDCANMADMKKLIFCLTLLDLFKTYSIDSKKLHQKIIEIVDKTPPIVKQVPFETLVCLSKLKLSPTPKKYVIDHLKSIVFEDLSTMIKYLNIVFTKFDEKPVLESFLSSLAHKIKTENCEKEDLLQLLKDLKILSNRQRDEDLTNLTNSLLELVYPKVSQLFLISSPNLTNTEEYKVDSEDILVVFDCYMTMLKNTSSIFMKNCLEGLVNYVLENREIFTPVQLVTILDHLNTCNRTKVLVKGEYMELSEVNNELIRYFLGELSKFEFGDLCELLYSLPLTHYFQLYHILSSYPAGVKHSLSEDEEVLKGKITEIVKRRIICSLDSNNSNNNNNMLYNKYIANIMIYNDYDLNNFFESNINTIVDSLSTNQLIQIIISHNHNNLNQKVVDKVLENVEKNLDVVTKIGTLTNLLEKNQLVKRNTNLTNKLFSTLIYRLINSKNGYIQLLQSIPYLSSQVDVSLINMVVQYSNRYLVHLSIYDIELVLLCINNYNVVDNNNLLVLLNHVYDINLSNIPNQILINILNHLKDLRVRHEPLIKKFTDKLLSSFKNPSYYFIPDLISLIDTLSSLSIPYNDLHIYLLNYLSNSANIMENKDKSDQDSGYTHQFGNLKVKDRINLLYSIANFGIVDQNLKKLYLSLINQLYPMKDGTSDADSDKLDNSLSRQGSNTKDKEQIMENDLLLKLYEIHIDLVLNSIYNEEVDVVGNRLEQASRAWFTRQELKSHDFKKSNTYISIKGKLEGMDLKFDSGVTEIYFCNFILTDREKPTVTYVVPSQDELRLWTTSLEPKNLIHNTNLFTGNSQKIIKNLKLSGYQVIELVQSKWDSVNSDQNEYLENLIKSS